MFDKKQKKCVKRIHLVTDNGLYDRKAFYTVKVVFYSSSINHRAYGLPILLRSREKLRLYTDYKSKKDAIDRTQKNEVLMKQVKINSIYFQAVIPNRSISNTSTEKIVVYRCSKTEILDF